MEYCKLEKVDSGNFYYSGASSMAMSTLAFFFTDDVGGSIDTWINFILDDKQIATSSNASELDKEGDFIILGDLLYYGDNRTDTLTIHKDDFIKMLLRWEELYKQQPDEIIITQDDQGKISMISKFNDGREI